jgi:IclR family acetate operon transcriptional repressor
MADRRPGALDAPGVRTDPQEAQRRPRGRPRAFDDKTEQNTIQSLDRAVRVLERLAQGGRTLSALAGDLEMAPATVYRILTTLEQRDLVELDPAAQTWHVGTGAFRIGSAFLRRTNIVERARPVMRRLMGETGETANLGMRRGDSVLFVSQVETHASIRAFFPPGTVSPLHASGIGKALLAVLPESEVARTLAASDLAAFTPKTLTDPDALMADLRQARAQGYAVDDEERNEGMRCVAAAVFNAAGEPVAGLSVSGPISRLKPEDVATMAASVRRAARDLSAALGAEV